MIIKFKKIINFIQPPWLKISYKKYIKPLKDVKQEKNPLNKISSLVLLNFLLMNKPTKNEPRIEITKLLSINNLRNVPK